MTSFTPVFFMSWIPWSNSSTFFVNCSILSFCSTVNRPFSSVAFVSFSISCSISLICFLLFIISLCLSLISLLFKTFNWSLPSTISCSVTRPAFFNALSLVVIAFTSSSNALIVFLNDSPFSPKPSAKSSILSSYVLI